MSTTGRTLIVLLLILHSVGCSVAHADGALPPTLPVRKQQTLKIALIGSAFVLASVAAILEIESDREYSRYLETAHPSKMQSYYDRAERYRNLSTAALLTAEVCAIGFVVLSLRQKPEGEPQSDTVRITFKIVPSRAEVSLLW